MVKASQVGGIAPLKKTVSNISFSDLHVIDSLHVQEGILRVHSMIAFS
jgi:hypothetical protein